MLCCSFTVWPQVVESCWFQRENAAGYKLRVYITCGDKGREARRLPIAECRTFPILIPVNRNRHFPSLTSLLSLSTSLKQARHFHLRPCQTLPTFQTYSSLRFLNLNWSIDGVVWPCATCLARLAAHGWETATGFVHPENIICNIIVVTSANQHTVQLISARKKIIFCNQC